MAPRRLVTVGYIIVFWGAVPGTLAGIAAWGQRLLGPRLRLPGLSAAGIWLAGASGIMLALSIAQFTRAAGSLPISAFPPAKLIRSGVFGVWRHPIYLFYGLCLSGTGLALWPEGTLAAAFPLLAAATFLYARREEAALERRFGMAYEGHRRQTSIIIPRLIHFLRWAAAALFRGFYRFEVRGRENAGLDPPFFVVSAHRNFLDPVFVLAAVNRPVHFVTTFELFRKPLARFLFTRLLGVPKRRYGPDLRDALEIRRRLRESCIVGIFPEAERSWTGEPIGFKPEALKLLRRRPGIPILPVRLEGTYQAWPRWAPFPRRAKVSASIGKAVFAAGDETMSEFESRLAGLIEPRRSVILRPRPIPVRGIEALLYRCPECLAIDAIRSEKRSVFRCSNCLARFELLSDLAVRKVGGDGGASLGSVSRRIRATLGSSATGAGSDLGPGMAAAAELAVEKAGRLESAGAGHIELSEEEVTFEAAGGGARIGLGTIRAVNVEGSRRLQIYGGTPPGLFQFTPRGQSALKWQHLIVNAVRRRMGVSPSTA